jgi:hypothetical protein
MENIDNKQLVLEMKNSGKPLVRKYFFKHHPDILIDIDSHNRKYGLLNELFSQEVYNWLNGLEKIPTCPLSGENLRFSYHKFQYYPYKGKGKRSKENTKKDNHQKVADYGF